MKDMTMFTDKQLEVMATQGDARSVHAKRELEKRGKGKQTGTSEGKKPTRKPRKTNKKTEEGDE